MSDQFKIYSKFNPAGHQPAAIESLCEGLTNGLRAQPCWGSLDLGKHLLQRTLLRDCRDRHW